MRVRLPPRAIGNGRLYRWRKKLLIFSNASGSGIDFCFCSFDAFFLSMSTMGVASSFACLAAPVLARSAATGFFLECAVVSASDKQNISAATATKASRTSFIYDRRDFLELGPKPKARSMRWDNQDTCQQLSRAYATPIIASLFSKPSLDIAQPAIELLDLTYLGANSLKPCPVGRDSGCHAVVPNIGLGSSGASLS